MLANSGLSFTWLSGGRPMADPVLFLDHAPALGGAEQSLLLLLKHLHYYSRWQLHVACTGGRLAEKATALGVSVHIVSMPRLRRSIRAPVDWLRGVWDITRVARKIGARILIANTVRAALYAAPAARLIQPHLSGICATSGFPNPDPDVYGLITLSNNCSAGQQSGSLRIPKPLPVIFPAGKK